MDNPYTPPKEKNEPANLVKMPEGAFKRGFRKGTLWSLWLAIPAAIGFVGEFHYSMSLRIDPVSRVGETVPLGLAEWTMMLVAGIGMALTVVTLPWAICAGLVETIRDR